MHYVKIVLLGSDMGALPNQYGAERITLHISLYELISYFLNDDNFYG